MSLPNYLAKIKSSGIYRFVWDKSEVPPQQAETLRLVVGYSEKGPFNTPVYIERSSDFIAIYGNISKKLERKGIFFHRMALQALSAGPILALNLKPFGNEQVTEYCFDANEMLEGTEKGTINITNVYDTNRFWYLDANQLPSKLNKTKYINIVATDVKESSCSMFIRPIHPESYNISIRQWFAANAGGEEMPAYLEPIQDELLNDYFAEVYVFRGKFTPELVNQDGPLGDYLSGENGSEWQGYLNEDDLSINLGYKDVYGQTIDALDAMAENPSSNFIAKYQGCLLPYFKDGLGNYASLDVLFNSDNNTHKMLMKLDESLLETAETKDDLNSYCKSPENNGGVKPVYVEGYTYSTIGKSDAGQVLQNKIFKVLQDKGIRTALTNRVDCEYHYLVDTFQSYIRTGCKAELASIAKEKDNAFAILNFPPISEFINDGQNRFVSKITGKFDIAEIANREKFSLVSESNGASYCAYYTGVVFSDGTLKQNVPSAAVVSNNFMDKYGARQPYYIVAGPNYGRIAYDGLVGPDYNYGRTDLDVLEPMGVNAIIYVPRKGTYINSNQTAKQVPVTALSKIHVRELVIYLQNEIESLLQNYQWELNTQVLRDTIKAKADTILENVKNNGGIYAYTNVCDSTNNTPEVIDNEMIILDTAIEPSRGAGKMVQQLTIHRTGGITSSTM